ncbi:MAG: LCP family protein [Lactobacillaceae bacterium]|jgi:LCP family protein required for cell wall assembly|nr:LCP family protein [Lactobacillaceae bacterium]
MKHPIRKLFLFLLLIIVIISGFGIYRIQRTLSKSQGGPVQFAGNSISQQILSGKGFSVLLMGTDTGALNRDYRGRTDSMMVLSSGNSKASLISLQRDTPITIDGSLQKLNAAYTFEGAQGAVTQVQNLLDIELNGYILINMGGLEKIVNALNGVDVVSPLTFSFEGYDFQEGQAYHVQGDQMLSFVRMRHEDPRGDYGRQVRQQLVINGIAKAAISNPSTILNSKFFDTVSENIITNLSTSDVVSLLLRIGSLSNMTQDQMVGTGEMIDGVSYQIMSDSEIQRVHDEISDVAPQ